MSRVRVTLSPITWRGGHSLSHGNLGKGFGLLVCADDELILSWGVSCWRNGGEVEKVTN